MPIPGAWSGCSPWATRWAASPPQQPPKPLEAGEYELNFVLGTIDDGRYANNGWLQELPDPVSKLTWDNALYISPKTADALGVNIRPPNNNIADVPDTDFSPRTSTITSRSIR